MNNYMSTQRCSSNIIFEILEELCENELLLYVSYVELVGTGGADLNNIINELNIIRQYKVAFDEALDMIYSGVAEKLLIEDENKW